MDIAQLPRLLLGGLDEVPHPGVLLKVGGDKISRLPAGEVCGLLQSVVAHPVDNTEVDRLGHAAHLWGDLTPGYAKDQGSSGGVDVFVLGKGTEQPGILREMG